MEFLRFIFSSFWVWLGFFALIATVGGVLVELVKSCKHSRRITAYRTGERWHVTVENASKDEAQNALISASLPRTEEADTGRDNQ